MGKSLVCTTINCELASYALYRMYRICPKYLDTSSQHTRGRLDLAVLFTPSTPNRQNRNQVRWNTCAGVRRSTPSSKVVQTEQSRDLLQNKMAEHCLHSIEIFFQSFPIGSDNYS